jgi:hypothetical protein
MPPAPLTPLVLKDVLLDVAGTDHALAVTNVTFTPSANTVTMRTLSPAGSFTDVAAATWSCQLTYAQDWDTATSLSRYLFENEGDTVAVTFRPRSGSGPSFTAQLTITPGAIGGAVDSYATAQVTLGVVGRPQLVPAA